MDFRVCSLLICVVALCGCGSSEKLPELVPVKGKVNFDGKPLQQGTISLTPTQPTLNWEQPAGTIANGEYELFTSGRPGAPVGDYVAVVIATEPAPDLDGRPGIPKSLVPPKFSDPGQSPLRLKVSATPAPNDYNLELRK
jgi:hypothetical protein